MGVLISWVNFCNTTAPANRRIIKHIIGCGTDYAAWQVASIHYIAIVFSVNSYTSLPPSFPPSIPRFQSFSLTISLTHTCAHTQKHIHTHSLQCTQQGVFEWAMPLHHTVIPNIQKPSSIPLPSSLWTCVSPLRSVWKWVQFTEDPYGINSTHAAWLPGCLGATEPHQLWSDNSEIL